MMNGVTTNGTPVTPKSEDKSKRKGSDPLISTARGKLQSRRSKLNDQINRELRMRNGAENLFRATGNKRLKELVAVELSFFNSNIQLLKEELSDLNSNVIVYQHENCTSNVPMIPLGLKETTECDIEIPIKDFILEHYSEDGSVYQTEIDELLLFRKAIRTPQRNEEGVELLTEYVNQLYYVEKRFSDKMTGLHFHWYDSLTGVPNTQKTIGFEKGSVLFNIGALYTQIGCKQDRTKESGIESAIKSFQLAAGTLGYIHNHFTNPPSMDMQPESLTMLVQLMMCQAQECVFERFVMKDLQDGMVPYIKAAQEAMMVSVYYEETALLMSSDPVKDYIPYSWISMAQVKHEYFKALAHHNMACAILDPNDVEDEYSLQYFLSAHLSTEEDTNENSKMKIPRSPEERLQIGKAHLKESLNCYEEALRLHDLCKQLRKIDTFLDILKTSHDECLKKFSELEEEDNFNLDLILSQTIVPRSERTLETLTPDFKSVKVKDIFARLGPIAIFNAKNEWSAPRTVILKKNHEQGFGFSVRGDCPVRIAEIEQGSVAEAGRLKVGDFVVAVCGRDTKWAKHEEVVNYVRQCGNSLELRLTTPLEVPDSSRGSSSPCTPRSPMNMKGDSLSSHSIKSNRSRLSAPWIFMRKGSKEKSDRPEKSKELEDGEIFLR